jgi:hypothetical protein
MRPTESILGDHLLELRDVLAVELLDPALECLDPALSDLLSTIQGCGECLEAERRRDRTAEGGAGLGDPQRRVGVLRVLRRVRLDLLA